MTQAFGDLGGTVDLTGTLGAPEATVDVAGSLAWPDQPAIESRAQAVITADAVRLTAFEATSGPARANSTLVIDLNSDTIDGTFDATSVAVESWLRRFDLSAPVTGVVDATGRLSGPLARIVIDADVTGGPVVVAGESFDRVTGKVQYDGLAVRATDVDARTGRGRHHGQSHLDPGRRRTGGHLPDGRSCVRHDAARRRHRRRRARRTAAESSPTGARRWAEPWTGRPWTST